MNAIDKSSANRTVFEKVLHALAADKEPSWSDWEQLELLQMRVQGEADLDELGMFTPAAYADWRTHEPDIDHMLDFVIEHLPSDRDARSEINARLGR